MATTLIERVRALLVADSAVAALVGTRIYPLKIPQNDTMPAIALTVISEVPENSFTSDDTALAFSRLQVDSYALRYLDARAVDAAVKAVIANLSASDLSAMKENSQDLYEDVTELHRVSTDYIVAM